MNPINKMLMKLVHIIFISLVTLLPVSCRETASAPERLVLEGNFTYVGNAPFAKLVFRCDDGKDYEVDRTEIKNYAGLQGKRLVIEGRTKSIDMRTADLKITRRINILSGIKIIREK
jgi:hypothetical protein